MLETLTTALEGTIPVVIEKATDGLSTTEAAEKLGVSRQAIQQWITSGKLPATQFGSRYRIDPEDLEKMRRQA